jgi:hypothetical protein
MSKPMATLKITGYHYYPDSDELDLVINVPAPRAAISMPLDNPDVHLLLEKKLELLTLQQG